jgi:very-short-patch-repair endonuclease
MEDPKDNPDKPDKELPDNGNQFMNLRKYKDFRKYLRNGATPAEWKLWHYLKGKQLEGRKFRRQHSVGKYVLDFYCPGERLAIELDGEIHNSPEAKAYDAERDQWISSFSITILRFKNDEVFNNIEEVLDEIKKAFDHPDPP